MKQPNTDYRIVMVSAPDITVGKDLVSGAVQRRLAACGKIFSQMQSYYWWENKVTSSQEYQLLFKTHENRLDELETWIISHHPYDTPELVVIPIESGFDKYLKWIGEETEAVV